MESRELIVSFRADTEGTLLYRSVPAPDFTLDAVAALLKRSGLAEAAFVKAAARVPEQDIERKSAPLTNVTPSWRSRQGYLDAAPGGVHTSALAGVAGAKGARVRVFDAEEDWETGHIDRPIAFSSVVFGPTTAAAGADQDHGTAVMGIIAAREDAVGVTGIAPDATVGLVRFEPNFSNSHMTIQNAVDTLKMKGGDILVLPIDRKGPLGKQIAIEWWPDDFSAIKYATGKGVIVVEAAGNSGENLDLTDYDTRLPGFSLGWSNPFKRGAMDSGAILVGAGAPPNGADPDRSRHRDSNYGTSVDVQGWGADIVTTGYGDLTKGSDTTKFYAANFGKTSGSTAMVAGVLACVQGARIAAGRAPWTPSEARNALRTTGSPQQASTTSPLSERIGSRPNLAQLLALALA